MIPPALSVFQLHFRLGNEPICSIPQQRSKFISRCFAAVELEFQLICSPYSIWENDRFWIFLVSVQCSAQNQWEPFNVAFSEIFCLFPYLPILPEKSLKMSHEIRSVQTKPNIILYLKFNLGLGRLLYLLITRTSTFFSNWQYFPLATTR